MNTRYNVKHIFDLKAKRKSGDIDKLNKIRNMRWKNKKHLFFFTRRARTLILNQITRDKGSRWQKRNTHTQKV